MARKNTFDDITVGSLVTIAEPTGEFIGRAFISTNNDTWLVIRERDDVQFDVTRHNFVRVRETGRK
jgi:hypothetical protein